MIDIYNSFKNGDLNKAWEYQTKANRLISVLLKYKIIPAAKVVMEAMGYEVGNAAFPMKRYTDEQKAQIVAEFKDAGLEI